MIPLHEILSKTGDEAAAPHLTARFQRAEDAEQIAIRVRLAFAREGLAQDDSGASEQSAGDVFDGQRLDGVVAQQAEAAGGGGARRCAAR